MKFYQLLTLLFIYLKLTEQIEWSWWLVILPFFAGVVLKLLVKKLEENKQETNKKTFKERVEELMKEKNKA